MDVKRSSVLADAVEGFRRNERISYGELLRAFELMNAQYRAGRVHETEDLNPRDLPGAKDWPDAWASRIWRDVQAARSRNMEA